MGFNAKSAISLGAALACVLGGLWLVPIAMGSDATPWPQVGMGAGWLFYRFALAPVLNRGA